MITIKRGYPVFLDGKAVRERRLALGLSMRELGKRAGLSLNSIYRSEQGGPARADTARQLARALDCTPTDLYAKDDI